MVFWASGDEFDYDLWQYDRHMIITKIFGSWNGFDPDNKANLDITSLRIIKHGILGKWYKNKYDYDWWRYDHNMIITKVVRHMWSR